MHPLHRGLPTLWSSMTHSTPFGRILLRKSSNSSFLLLKTSTKPRITTVRHCASSVTGCALLCDHNVGNPLFRKYRMLAVNFFLCAISLVKYYKTTDIVCSTFYLIHCRVCSIKASGNLLLNLV